MFLDVFSHACVCVFQFKPQTTINRIYFNFNSNYTMMNVHSFVHVEIFVFAFIKIRESYIVRVRV